MKYYSIEKLDCTGLVKTVCTYKEVGKWKYGEEGALSNYEELGRELGITPDDMVRPSQTHTTVVRAVTHANGGNGVVRLPDEGDCDGLITNEKGLLLCTREADCVPVFMLDPVNRAIGMIHSGWKGTAGLISIKAIHLMELNYGTKKEDLLIAFGPSICKNCYQVGDDLIPPFLENFSEEEVAALFMPDGSGKYKLDVAGAVKTSLLRFGIPEENIFSCPICTYHDGLFPSYRLDKSYISHMLTGIMLL